MENWEKLMEIWMKKMISKIEKPKFLSEKIGFSIEEIIQEQNKNSWKFQ